MKPSKLSEIFKRSCKTLLQQKSQSETLENMRCIAPGGYVVWTQAGFKKAIHDLVQRTYSEIPVEGYPRQYPCVVNFVGDYRGYHYWFADCCPLAAAIEQARDRLQTLTDIDTEHRAAIASRKGKDL